ncbi:MAG: Jag N-terminal domain-containing protein [Syntrophales bacterium LBB04]|nr:Jag N-terminal domain-containing protein [Syntrophales bacterium LBB04]
MKSVEIEGKTIDEAIDNACEELQVSRDKLNIEIISEGTSGFLGIGHKKAKIKATLLSLDEELSYSLDPPTLMEETSHISAPHTSSAYPHGTEEAASERAKELLEGILERMNLDCPVTAEETQDKITLNIEGNGGGLLIGRRGQNLDALQYIVNKAMQKSNSSRKMVVVDTESYRKRREDSLSALAARIGAKVKKTNKAVTLSYLNAHNRRIIHMALQNDASLSTKSRGEGEYRKIIIVPVKKD